VQAGYIHDEILRLRGEYPDIPLYAVIGDMCASGGYYVAVAADAIYANRASVVGSIGVVMGSFGFVDAMEKLGVERRLLTAGEHKAFFDPFSPVKEDEVAHLEGLLDEIHGQFIQVVQEGRGEALTDAEELFSGFVWTGSQGVELGLVDALGSAGYVAREVIGVERVVDFSRKPDYLERFADRLGMVLARVLTEQSVHGTLEGAQLR
jgi:protease-4